MFENKAFITGVVGHFSRCPYCDLIGYFHFVEDELVSQKV